MAHRHDWDFLFSSSGWTAACGRGLEVAVERQPDGWDVWRWRLHGDAPPPSPLLGALSRVTTARRELVARDAGRD